MGEQIFAFRIELRNLYNVYAEVWDPEDQRLEGPNSDLRFDGEHKTRIEELHAAVLAKNSDEEVLWISIPPKTNSY